ncbi:hypothetical protein KJ707_01055 [Patescibacteria group bacterium]|nr:hypothetical protein [Patescibacteria group bacterium]MBU1966820.1 hypothetical protein [Patescibacteria group bacterium]MBU2543142.1 hypothetical protein [Patescibacteria group bacterium]
MSDQEKERSPELGFNKEDFQAQLFEKIGKMFDESDLGTPGEESMGYFEKIVAALPEGKARLAVEGLRKPVEVSAKVNDFLSKIKDKIWALAKKALAAEVPLVLLLPDDINSKIDAGIQRFSGNVGEQIIAWGLRVIEEMKNPTKNVPSPMMA